MIPLEGSIKLLGGGANYELREESNDMSDPNSWIWNLGDKVFELGDTNKTIAQRAKAELETTRSKLKL